MTKRLTGLLWVLLVLLAKSGVAQAAQAALDCNNATNNCIATGEITGSVSFSLIVSSEAAKICKSSIKFNYSSVGTEENAVAAYTCASTAGTKYTCMPAQPNAAVDLSKGALVANCNDGADGGTSLSTPKPVAPKAPTNTGKKQGAAAVAPATGPSFLPLSDWKNVLDALHLPIAGKKLGQYYDRAGDTAVLFFDADGTPYFPLPDVIDEDDDIYVAIVDTADRLTGLEVGLTGCNRVPTEPRVYGSITGARGSLAGGGSPPPPAPLSMILRAVGKCEGADTGGPQLTIRSPATNLTHAVTIPVNELYRFAVGVGVGLDFTLQRAFDLRTAPGDTVPRIVETHDIHGIATLIDISFYLSPRDFHKTGTDAIGQRFQLFAGLDPANFSKSLTIGTGVELAQGFNVLLGWRVLSKQTVLAEGSGLKSGSSFDGTRDSLPTRERWELGLPYLGIGLSSDLITRLK